jgi:hypothetical protein
MPEGKVLDLSVGGFQVPAFGGLQIEGEVGCEFAVPVIAGFVILWE